MTCQCAQAHAMVVPVNPLLFLQCLLSTHTGNSIGFPFGCEAKSFISLSFPSEEILLNI